MKNFFGVTQLGEDITTENLVPGSRVYGEKILKEQGKEFRVIDPYRVKLGAAIKLGLNSHHIGENSKVLYLGAGNGTTASHISDIAKNGLVYAVEFSPRAMLDLFQVCKVRKNLIPIFADANKPLDYASRISEADLIYMDVAQKTQVDILNKNVDFFLKDHGFIIFMIKARSIDVTLEPKKVFGIVENQLMQKYKLHEKLKLEPYEKDHMCMVLQKR